MIDFSTNLLLSFAADHPFSAFWLGGLIMLTLVAWAWVIAGIVEKGMNTTMWLANVVVILVRGYAPTVLTDEDKARSATLLKDILNRKRDGVDKD